MYINSPDFEDGQHLSETFTCDGAGMHPELHVYEIPPDTKSLALIVDDPDAPSGSFIHWLLWNIEPREEVIIPHSGDPEGSVQGTNSSGKRGWIAPCPPPDDPEHRYYFKIYALDDKLDVSSIASGKELRAAIGPHVLAEAEIVGKYGR